MFRIGKTNRARQSVRIFLGADYAKEISIQIESARLAAAPRLFVLLAVADDASSMLEADTVAKVQNC